MDGAGRRTAASPPAAGSAPGQGVARLPVGVRLGMMALGPSRWRPPHPPSNTPPAVAFVNEVVSDADIDAYGLPFEKGKGHWWTRDKERNLYLWGGRGGNPLRDEEIRGRFHFFVSGVIFKLEISVGNWSENWHARPYIIEWGNVLCIDPVTCADLSQGEVLDLAKEALVAYGRDGRYNRNTTERIVRFGF